MIVYFTLLALIIPSLGAAVARQTSSSEKPLNYAPKRVECPQKQQWLRPACGLSHDEATWVQGRKPQVLKGLEKYIAGLKWNDFDCSDYIQRLQADVNSVPMIAFAISGGAWASAMTGTAALRALDARFAPAVQERTGGLLQSTTYIAGLSGGAWPVMSLATNNFPEIDDMVSSWRLDQTPIGAPRNTKHRATIKKLLEQVDEKFEAGFDVAFADFLGRGLGYEFVAGPQGAISTLFSDVANLSNFQNHEMPFPLFQAAQGGSQDPTGLGIEEPLFNATLFEWSPFEFGSWDGPEAFFPLQYLGTPMADGAPVNDCVVGFDNAGYLLGVTGDAWNYWLLGDISNNTLGAFYKRSINMFPLQLIQKLNQTYEKYFGYTGNEALYATLPNPFASKNSIDNNSSPPQNLTLLDESEQGQPIPYWTLTQPAREMDFIISWDNPEDASPYLWNNGTALYSSYIYAKNRNIPFPVVPSVATIMNRGYNMKPTLFGCNADLTTTNDTRAPIILYMANAPYSSYVNASSLQPAFTREQMGAILTNGFNYVSQGNGTLAGAEDWPECLGCAAIDRSLARVGMSRTLECDQCMKRWCWDGVEDDRTPGVIDPPLRLDPSVSFEEWNQSSPYWPIIP